MDTIPQDIPQFKQCRICLKMFPADTKHFHRRQMAKDGLNPACKECANALQRKPPKEYHKPETKGCTQCHTVFPTTREYFYPHKGHKDGLDSACKACCAKRARTYDRAEYYRQWVASHREHIQSYEKYKRMRDREQIRAAHRRYRQKHKDVINSSTRNRRSRKRESPGFHSAQDIERQYESQHGHCYWCGKKFRKGLRAYHVDHIVPLARGGSNWPDNLVLACHACNESRGGRLPSEWDSPYRRLL